MRRGKPPVPIPVTSHWSARLPEGYTKIGISRGAPRRQRGYRLYRSLAPGPWFRSVTPGQFRRLYLAQLAKLDAHQVLHDLAVLAGGRTPTLLCFEPPPPEGAWCHRGLVSVWFAVSLNISVVEYGHEDAGWGWAHPKLPAEWRKQHP